MSWPGHDHRLTCNLKSTVFADVDGPILLYRMINAMGAGEASVLLDAGKDGVGNLLSRLIKARSAERDVQDVSLTDTVLAY